ncbi:MAG: choice-of-anchor D domain-containing protein [Terracidiphilus sp.]
MRLVAPCIFLVFTAFCCLAAIGQSAAQAALKSPEEGSMLSGSSAKFSWTSGTGATAYKLYLGTIGAGSYDLHNSGRITANSVIVNDIPKDGATIYVTLSSEIGGKWESTHSTLTEAVTPVPAALTSPASGSVLPGSSATFSWTAGSGVTDYRFRLGTTAGSNNLYGSGTTKATSVTVTGLPTEGATIYGTLYSEIDGAWQSAPYTFVEAGTLVPAALMSPAPGSVLPGSSISFSWTPGSGPTAYMLYLGTAAGSGNLYNSGSLSGTSVTVAGLPTNGAMVYASLFSKVNGAWQPASYTFMEAGLTAVSCTSSSMTGAGTDSCVVSMSGATGSSGMTIALSSNNAAVSVPASVTVPGGATSAAFTATASAVSSTQTASLTAAAGGISASFGLQLNASVPAMTLSASSLSFGSVNLNTPAAQTVTLTSSGTAALTINSATLAGAGFSVSGATFPVTLNPNQTATLQVQFDPTAAGAATGTLTIASNATSGGTATVSLSGTGVATLSSLSCSNSSMTGAGSDSCTVSLNGAAPSGGLTVSLASSDSAVTVPATVAVPASATSASLTATVSAVTSTQTATLTAGAGSASTTFALQLNA